MEFYFLIHQKINTKINYKALKARHKKLKATQYSGQRNLWKLFFVRGEKKQTKEEFQNVDLAKTFHLSASRFATKIALFAVTFLLIYSAFPSYSSYAVFNDGFGENYEYTSNELLFAEEGFLLKPSLITEKSDRTQFTNAIQYEVKPGDTLSGIASQFEIKTKTILDNNSIANVNSLKTGMILTILPVDGVLHTVKKGENVTAIAKTYKVEKDKILAQNKLKDESVKEGATVIVPGGEKIIPRYIASRASASESYRGAGYGTIDANYNGTVSASIIKPASGQITQYFRRGHYAIDIGNRNKGPILAAANGVVTKAQGGYNGGYGNMIVVDHGNGRETLYAHNSAIYVKVGDNVTQGQTIGWMGNTGRVYGATGIHLHFELRVNGSKVNPLLYIQ